MRDLTGQRFGRLVALEVSGRNKYGNLMWLCKCDCGNMHTVPSGKLIQGKSKSCGCYAKEVHAKSLEKHGITTGGKPRTFTIWCGMKARCLDPKAISYKSYGARGITVCQEWLGEQGFENFHNWAIANGYTDELTIDRIDNNGNYEPNNCRWVEAKENRKKQRNVHYVEAYSLKLSVSDWCRKVNMSKSTAYKYLNRSENDFKKMLGRRLEKDKCIS